MTPRWSCQVCGRPAKDGPTVLGLVQPLCAACADYWWASKEWERGQVQAPLSTPLKDSQELARAFIDWRSRALAERRNSPRPAEGGAT